MTSSSIQPLPLDVIHLMAAGEVIDSLAAVVRELVENAVDAQATRITIALYPEQWRVRVTDNGNGISEADLYQAARAHSTSKIRDSQDLWRIHSLGFRGEALHSLAQLGCLEICSRVESGIGWRALYNPQGEVIQMDSIAIAPGTIVTVSDLFQIWPARRQALPTPAQQLRAIQTVIQQLALCHPQVTWQVEHHDRPWFTLYPGSTARSLLPQFLREVQLSDLQEITLTPESNAPEAALAGQPKLYLLLGLPDRCHRYRPDWIRVAINGRCVKLPELEQTVLAAFRRVLPRDRYPICFLHLWVTADQVDWNRHPAKTEVYLQHLADWQQWITKAITAAQRLNPITAEALPLPEQVGQLLKTAEASGAYGGQRSIQPLPEQHSQFLLPLRAVAQVNNTYIVVEHANGLWLVEQHIAHERVLYEQLRDRWEQVPLEPVIILSQLTPTQLAQLQRLGLEVDPFGEELWAVRTAPKLLAQRADCAEALMELSLGNDLEAALVATACRSAIRNGTPLSLIEMQTLLEQWQQTQNPRTCPHGRPIYLPLEESELSRFFRRHWVIGKSHGI